MADVALSPRRSVPRIFSPCSAVTGGTLSPHLHASTQARKHASTQKYLPTLLSCALKPRLKNRRNSPVPVHHAIRFRRLLKYSDVSNAVHLITPADSGVSSVASPFVILLPLGQHNHPAISPPPKLDARFPHTELSRALRPYSCQDFTGTY